MTSVAVGVGVSMWVGEAVGDDDGGWGGCVASSRIGVLAKPGSNAGTAAMTSLRRLHPVIGTSNKSKTSVKYFLITIPTHPLERANTVLRIDVHTLYRGSSIIELERLDVRLACYLKRLKGKD